MTQARVLHLQQDLGISDAELAGLSDSQFSDLVDERLEDYGATDEQREATLNSIAHALLEKYYNEDIQHYGAQSYDADNANPSARYVSIQPSVATLDLVRKATRRPDILLGIATNKFGVMAAAPGTGKSMLALTMCAAVASGQTLIGFEPSDTDGQNALFVSLEEDSDEILLRWQAINQVYDIDTADRLHIAGENNVRFRSAGGPEEFINKGVYDLAELIAETGAKFVVLDPLAEWRLGAEDNPTFSLFASAIKLLCRDCDTTIMVIHHVRKPPPGLNTDTHNADSIRGATHLRGAARSILLLDYEPKIGPNVLSVSLDKVQYGQSKRKLPPLVISEEIVETDTGNYATGVLTEYVPPLELPMPAHVVDTYRNALNELFDSNESYRADIRSPQWLGVGLSESLGTDIGAGRKASERTESQTNAMNMLKNDITKLVRMELIAPSSVCEKFEKSR